MGFRTGHHVTRFSMYRALAQKVTLSGHVLSIAGSDKLCRVLGAEDIVDAPFPQINILNLPYGDGEWDAVVSDQVMEHVEGSPERAFSESFRVVKPGGMVVHTTCFIQAVHAAPYDFWRFTPRALKLLAENAGGDVVECGGWGNPLIPPMTLAGLHSVPVPLTRWHPLNRIATMNHKDWPMVVWVAARRRL